MPFSGSLEEYPVLEGNLTGSCTLEGSLSEIPQLNGVLSEQITYKNYEGLYDVTPAAKEEIVLETKDKVLNQDVVIGKIPYYETTNLSDGKTVYIGSEVEIYEQSKQSHLRR